MSADIKISRVVFKNYKAFSNFSLSIHQMNILIGPNNCGKSTIIGVFRILDIAIRRARSKSADFLPEGIYGYELSPDEIPISLENVHTNYSEANTYVSFYLSNGNKMTLSFPPGEKRCYFSAETTTHGRIRMPKLFRREFPLDLIIVPVMGPVEHEEDEKTLDTIKKGLATHRASRHFRNYWMKFPEDFENFANLVKETWKGITIEKPYKVDPMDSKLVMFCKEGQIPRELYWAGFGFQIWCQLLTHISRAKNKDLLIIDEPEIYLHPEVQRQLINILRDLGTDILIATHSTEILSEADASEVLLIDKSIRSANRLKDIAGVQIAIEKIGSIQNITLSQLARNKKILFTEGKYDYKILRRFGKKLGYDNLFNGQDITAIESRGFSTWKEIKSFSWGFKTTFNAPIKVAAIFDRDFWCDEEIEQIERDLAKHIDLAYIHKRKEMENYLLNPEVLQRLFEKLLTEKSKREDQSFKEIVSISDLLKEISEPLKIILLGQYLSKRINYLKSCSSIDDAILNQATLEIFENKWERIETRMEVIKGSDVLSSLRIRLQEMYGITLTDYRIIDEYKIEEIPNEITSLIDNLEMFRRN